MCRNVPEMEIASIEFGLLSPEMMERISSAEVVSIETPDDPTKAQGTLTDPRMGPQTPNQRCVVCHKTIEEGCLGHFGIIHLPDPVINPLLVDAVIDTINSISPCCGKIIPFPEARIVLHKRKLRELQYALRELEENFYKGKITFEEYRSKYQQLHKEIKKVEDKIREAVSKARERYIEEARAYFNKYGKAPLKFARRLKKERERYIKTMTPVIICPEGNHRFYRMGHKTEKHEVVCPICGKKFSVIAGKAHSLIGVRCPYCDELINVIKYRKDKDSVEIRAVKIAVKPKKVSVSKSKRKKRGEKTIKLEEVIVEEGEGEEIHTTVIEKILRKIPDEDALVLGRHPENSRPERAILRALIVPPNQLRAKTVLQQGQTAEYPLNNLYKQVIQAANQLRSSKEAQSPEKTISSMYNALVAAIRNLFHIKGSSKVGTKNVKGLGAFLRGKKGLFRRYMTGKRVDFSARSVISPDPFLSINEVGVPVEVAMVLTAQEVVNEYNVERLEKLVKNGPEKYPGATTIIYVDKNRETTSKTPDVASAKLEFLEKIKQLMEGKLEEHIIVERHMLDGDPVLFNRQPSLHRMSMMAFHARVLPYRTFRMNLAVCPPFNADFDGDEMNLHQLQLPEARIEAEMIMLAEKHIMTPRYGAPIIGGNEDHITAAAMISYGESKVPKHIARHLLGFSGYEGEYPQDDVVHTRDLISLLIPQKIHMLNRSRLCDAVFRHKCPFYKALGTCPVEEFKKRGKEKYLEFIKSKIEELKARGVDTAELEKKLLEEEPRCPFDVYMEIKGGKILSGILDKSAIGAEKEFTIIHHIVRRYGLKKAGEFIDRAFRMMLKFLTYNGFTVSAKDFDLPDDAFDVIKEVFKEYDKKIEKLYDDYRNNRLIAEIGLTVEETFKTRLRKLLDELRDKAAAALIRYIIERGLVFENNVLIMTGTKARGDITQFAQMMVTVGAMTVRGQFISRGFTGRTLSHFKPGILEPKAMGFVRSSFRLGMDPIEYFFQAAAGRDGLIDTATKTSDSGYLQRKMIHNLEDIVVEYDGTVRTLYGDIVQFFYGEDGIDVTKSDYGKIDVRRIVQEVIDDLDANVLIGLLKKKKLEKEIVVGERVCRSWRRLGGFYLLRFLVMLRRP